jgi:hypothetical protein
MAEDENLVFLSDDAMTENERMICRQSDTIKRLIYLLEEFMASDPYHPAFDTAHDVISRIRGYSND